jgi:hypothetical protein
MAKTTLIGTLSKVEDIRQLTSGKWVEDLIIMEAGFGANPVDHPFHIQSYSDTQAEARKKSFKAFEKCKVEAEVFMNGYQYDSKTKPGTINYNIRLSLKSLIER